MNHLRYCLYKFSHVRVFDNAHFNTEMHTGTLIFFSLPSLVSDDITKMLYATSCMKKFFISTEKDEDTTRNDNVYYDSYLSSVCDLWMSIFSHKSHG